MQRTTSRVGLIAALLALGCALAEPAFARGGRGGGGGGMRAGGMSRGGGGGGMRASGGGGMRSSGGMRASSGGGLRSSASTSMSRGGYSRPSSGYQRPSGGYNRGSMAANRPASGANRGQMAANRGQGARTGDRVNTGDRINGGDRTRGDNRINTGDRGGNRINTGNINAGNSINIDNDGGWGGWNDYPVGAGLALGTAAAVTAAAWGSVMYSMPPSCSPYPYGGYSYYNCGGTYYESRYEGDTVVYVTVPQPGTSDASVVVSP